MHSAFAEHLGSDIFMRSGWRNGLRNRVPFRPQGFGVFDAVRMLLHLLEVVEIARYFGAESHT